MICTYSTHNLLIEWNTRFWFFKFLFAKSWIQKSRFSFNRQNIRSWIQTTNRSYTLFVDCTRFYSFFQFTLDALQLVSCNNPSIYTMNNVYRMRKLNLSQTVIISIVITYLGDHYNLQLVLSSFSILQGILLQSNLFRDLSIQEFKEFSFILCTGPNPLSRFLLQLIIESTCPIDAYSQWRSFNYYRPKSPFFQTLQVSLYIEPYQQSVEIVFNKKYFWHLTLLRISSTVDQRPKVKKAVHSLWLFSIDLSA